ncbi:hypothetical protein JTB14_011103 [Gonioctena quinquepunctata]|nr:hypothetical protein JTB14_011103 [Gonioctena quinquepunctata]
MASVLSGYTDNFHLQRVLERLRSPGLWLSPAKCNFGFAELNYLGRVVSQRGNRPQEEHVMNTVNFTVPRSVKQLRGFLGTAGWLREYIPHFAEISAPLTSLRDIEKKFHWTPEAQGAFEKPTELVSEPLELARQISVKLLRPN